MKAFNQFTRFFFFLLFSGAMSFSSFAQCSIDSVYDSLNFIWPTGITERCLLSNDMDNDGDNDIIIARGNTPSSSAIYLYSNTDGIGSFGEETLIFNSPGRSILAIAIEDMDGDGAIDILANRNGGSVGNGTLELLLNPGDNNFSDPILLGENLGALYNDLVALDFDQDGDNDVVMISDTDNSAQWFENIDGFGQSWQQYEIGEVIDPRAILAEDVNADGLLDVIVCSAEFTDYIVWFENLGDEVFSDFQIIATDVNSPVDIILEDIDGDGIKDIIAGDNNGDAIYNYKGLGSGNFSPRQDISAVNGFKELLSQDVDCDGDMDIISGGNSGLQLHENIENSSSWSTSIITNAHSTYRSIEVSDLNGDGIPDLLFASVVGDALRWYPNICPCALTSTFAENRINDIQLFPNPANNAIHLKIPQDIFITKSYIYDTSGRLISQIELPDLNKEIDIRTLLPGFYSLLVISDDGSIGRKSFVKQ